MKSDAKIANIISTQLSNNIILKEYLKSCQQNEKSDYIKYLDLTEIFDNIEDVVFFDKAHVNDLGYKILSEKISEAIQG